MDLAVWAEKQFARWTWVHLLAGLASAAILAYLISIPMVQRSIPFWKVAEQGGDVPGVVSHLYPRQESRGFFTMPNEKKDDGVFDLLVIADSSLLIIDPPPEYAYKQQKRFTLTRMIASHIETIGGKKLRIHEYYQDGTRTSDTRRALLKGLSDPNIDAVAIALNPFLYFNDFMAYSNTTQRSKLLYMDGLEASDYVQLAKILRPSDIMMDALSRTFPFYDRRYVISQMELAKSRQFLGTGLPFPVRKLPKPGPAYMLQRWVSWLYPRDLDASIKRVRGNYFYAASIQTNNLGAGSIGETTLRANLHTLQKWGKPAILYFPPVRPQFIKNPNWPMMQQIVQRVKEISAQVPAKNVKIVTSTLTKAYPPVLYHDDYHMKSGEGFVHQFADLLEQNLGMPIVRKDISNMFGPGS